MTRAETTKFLGELLVSTRLNGAGKYWASEVSIDPWTTKGKRVDYMQFLPENQMTVSGIEKGSFTCYEVKSCKEAGDAIKRISAGLRVPKVSA